MESLQAFISLWDSLKHLLHRNTDIPFTGIPEEPQGVIDSHLGKGFKRLHAKFFFSFLMVGKDYSSMLVSILLKIN